MNINQASVYSQNCAAPDCDQSVEQFGRQRCRYHDILATARWLTPDQYAQLLHALSGLTVLTDEERQEHDRRGRLRLVRMEATVLARSRANAIEHGCTVDEVDSAITAGTSQWSDGHQPL